MRPSKGSGRAVRQIVGMAGIDGEFHLAVPSEVLDHGRAGLEIGLAAMVASRADHRVEVAAGVCYPIGEAGVARLPGARHPDRAG
jgi:hypothetical protein